MKPVKLAAWTLALILLALAAWPTPSLAGDWYVHRTRHQMSEPPWYCYCYRIAKDSVLPGIVTYPMDMQVTQEQALSKLDQYAGLQDTCTNNCGFGTDTDGDEEVFVPPLAPEPAPECKDLEEFGGCEGFCKGKAEGESGLEDAVKQCIADCFEKYHCER